MCLMRLIRLAAIALQRFRYSAMRE